MAEPTVLTLPELKENMKVFQGEVEAKVKELIAGGADTTGKAVAELKSSIVELKKYQDHLDEQIKQERAARIPGLKEEAKKFDFGACVKGMYLEAKGKHTDAWKDAGFEKEVIDAATAKRKDAVGSDGAYGGYLIPQEIGDEVISLAVARTPILQMGATILSGLTADLAVNRVTGRPAGYWVGENTAPTKEDTTFGQTWLRPKKVGAFSKISNRLIYQSRGVADKVIRQELSIAMSLQMNQGLTNGKGTEYQPKGILNQPNTTASTIPSTGLTNGKRYRIGDLENMQMDLDVANELIDSGKYGYLLRPEVKSGLRRERVVMYSGASAEAGLPVDVLNPLMSDARIKEMLG